MPKTIHEKWNPPHGSQPTFVPQGWAYIGGTVQGFGNGRFSKVPVFDYVNRSWWQLNSDDTELDFIVRDITWNGATIDILKERDIEYGKFELKVTPTGAVVELPDDTDWHKITGLTHNTSYTVSLRVWKTFEHAWSEWTDRSFKTLDNPPPLPPSLSTRSVVNSYIDLTWNDPAGSSAVAWNVYVGREGGSFTLDKKVTAREARVITTLQDTKYMYTVAGVNGNGLEGPRSNVVKWRTGHEERRSVGRDVTEPIHPYQWGSWRNDIGWNDWHHWPKRVNQTSVFQGFWSNDYRRYRGCITYHQDDIRARLNGKYGGGTWENFQVDECTLRKFYRMRSPGNVAPQWMFWHMTNTNIFNSGEPPRYWDHINNSNSPDSLAGHKSAGAGTYHEWLRFPRWFGRALIIGHADGTPVNGLCLFRGDSEYNGFGYGGYGEWCGHMARDRAYPRDAWRSSDLTFWVRGSWNFTTVAYVGPSQW